MPRLLDLNGEPLAWDTLYARLTAWLLAREEREERSRDRRSASVSVTSVVTACCGNADTDASRAAVRAMCGRPTRPLRTIEAIPFQNGCVHRDGSRGVPGVGARAP